MKESTGGALLMGLAAGIIIIFIIMVAFFISYGKAFRIKNEIINRLEEQEGMSKSNFDDIITVKYPTREVDVCYNRIERSLPAAAGGGTQFIGFTMETTVYIKMDETILGSAFNLRIPVRGETKMIEKGSWYEHLAASSSNKIDGFNECT